MIGSSPRSRPPPSSPSGDPLRRAVGARRDEVLLVVGFAQILDRNLRTLKIDDTLIRALATAHVEALRAHGQ